jgi:hypothetical protein
MKEAIEVKDIVEKINLHVSVLKRGDSKASGMEYSKKLFHVYLIR